MEDDAMYGQRGGKARGKPFMRDERGGQRWLVSQRIACRGAWTGSAKGMRRRGNFAGARRGHRFFGIDVGTLLNEVPGRIQLVSRRRVVQRQRSMSRCGPAMIGH
jgi:hypothetical protein